MGILIFGFLLGLKHATESDHLAAVSTIVTERRNLWSSAIIGGIWGLGHTISLFIAGVLVLLLGFQISEQTERFLEFCVGIMLVLLGLNVLRKVAASGTPYFHNHQHAARSLPHPHVRELAQIDQPNARHSLFFSPRALFIGMIHGMAGSTALMLLIIPTIDSKLIGLLYIIIFGVGSIGGMMLMSLLVGLPFSLTALRFNRFNFVLQAIAGIISCTLGLLIIYEKGVTEKMFG